MLIYALFFVFLQKKVPVCRPSFFQKWARLKNYSTVSPLSPMISNYLPDTGCFLIGSQKSVRIYKPAGTWSLFFNFSSTTFCFSAALIFFASPYSETDLNCSGAVPQLMKSLKRGIFHVESFNLPSSFKNRIFRNEKRRRSIFSEIVTKSCVCGKGRWSVWAKNYCSLILQSTRATKNDLYHTLYKLGSYWPVGFFLKHSTGYSKQWTTYRAALPLGFQKLPTENADIKMH